MDIYSLSENIKSKALSLGFDACGIAKAGYLKDDAGRLEEWLIKGMHGSMQYMENHFEKRTNPTRLLEGAKSVISVIVNYYPGEKQAGPDVPKISKYALGEDYHQVLKKRLKQLLVYIQELIPDTHGRAFVDSAPVLDRAWANAAGLGWIGKNSNLISPKQGSFVFISSLIVDINLQYDQPLNTDLCGGCNKCITACPTKAIIAPRVVDGSRCISYFTIENKGEIPGEYKGKFKNWAFGCDICQDVCPWNKKVKISKIEEFTPNPLIINMKEQDWENLDEKRYNIMFKKSAVKRAKFEGLKRNLDFLKD
ncbi:MAG: tRNA epoxyqueuosine(34) reductase QueG [Bacteroidales bacterium]|nr:tRNA epoxyqueuosine(34) reductase QueG [Bacteroidales bacterium]